MMPKLLLVPLISPGRRSGSGVEAISRPDFERLKHSESGHSSTLEVGLLLMELVNFPTVRYYRLKTPRWISYSRYRLFEESFQIGLYDQSSILT